MAEKTAEQIRHEVLSHIAAMVQYWHSLPDKTPLERTNGVVFSMLVMLDGGAGLPAFIVAPSPHPDDRAYLESEGDDWYPENSDGTLKGEITENAELHGLWISKYEPKP